MTDDERIAAIRALTNAATPGPWTASERVVEDLHFGPVRMTCVDGPERNLLAVHSMPLPDAEFIAAARTGVPWLLDRLAEVTAKRREAALSHFEHHSRLHEALTGRAPEMGHDLSWDELIRMAAEVTAERNRFINDRANAVIRAERAEAALARVEAACDQLRIIAPGAIKLIRRAIRGDEQ